MGAGMSMIIDIEGDVFSRAQVIELVNELGAQVRSRPTSTPPPLFDGFTANATFNEAPKKEAGMSQMLDMTDTVDALTKGDASAQQQRQAAFFLTVFVGGLDWNGAKELFRRLYSAKLGFVMPSAPADNHDA